MPDPICLCDLSFFRNTIHLAMAAIERIPRMRSRSGDLDAQLESKLRDHRRYIEAHGQDMPEIRDWTWRQ
ncbi:MAG: hypothetical protein WBW74_08840 [Xanthobacteraceae bacterium]